VAKLEPIATSAAAFDLCGRFHLMRGEVEEARALEKRALDVDPTCINCLIATAESWHAQGQLQRALDTANLALAMMPEGEQPTAIYRMIASYRRKLRSDGKGAEPAGNDGARPRTTRPVSP
jgi:tetratricopeptide (TPR) repeat protein